jgi:hypothetical protein
VRLRLFLFCCVAAGCVDLARPARLAEDASRARTDAGTDGARDAAGLDTPVIIEAGPPLPSDGSVIDVDVDVDVDAQTAPIAIGRPCGQGDQCASGFCAQGFCCNAGCSEACVACNLSGAEGQCQPVPAGEDPKENCAEELAATCGQDGTCDGQGACRRYQLNAACAAGGCSGGMEMAASTCDGNGSCRPGTSTACPSGACSGSSCGAPCTATTSCQSGFYCGAGRCVLKLALASVCSTDDQCASAFCADGVCCNSRCGETCFACNTSNNVGTCKPVPVGLDPRNQCVAEAASTCGRAGGCNGSGGCRLHAAGVVCAAGSCSGLVETPARTCDGIGVCRAPGVAHDCSPYSCSGTACESGCSTASSCAPGYSCLGNACGRSPTLGLFWRFEEPSGTTAVDSSGNGSNGVYMGDTGTPVPSTSLPALSYANSSSRAFTLASRHAVWLETMPPALKPKNEVSLSAWYRATEVDVSTGGPPLPLGSEIVSGGNSYSLRLRANASGVAVKQIEFSKRIANNTFQAILGNAPTFLDGNWHHVAGVASASGGMKVYYDGVEVGAASTQTDDIVYTTTAHSFWVGRHGDGQTQWDFSGNIDEVRMYTRVLSAAEIATLAQGRNN